MIIVQSALTRFLRNRHKSMLGLSFIEVLVTMVAATVLTAGLYKVLQTSERQQADERKAAEAGKDIKRLLTTIDSELQKVHLHQDIRDWGTVLFYDGELNPVNQIAAPPNDKGVDYVYPDTLVYFHGEAATYGIEQDFDPEGTSVRLSPVDGNALPPIRVGDVLTIYDRSKYVAMKVASQTLPGMPPFDIQLEAFTTSPFTKKDGTPVTHFQKVFGGSDIVNQPASMDNIKATEGAVQITHFKKIFCALDSDGHLAAYLADNSNQPTDYQKLASGLFDCQFTGYKNNDFAVEETQVSSLYSSYQLTHVDANFSSIYGSKFLSQKTSIALKGSDSSIFQKSVNNVDAIPSDPWVGEHPGPSIMISNSGTGNYAVARAAFETTIDCIVSGAINIIDSNGDNVNVTVNTDTPIVGIFQIPEDSIDPSKPGGPIIVFAARKWETFGGGHYTGKIYNIYEDANGDISAGSNTGNQVLDQFAGTPIAMTATRVDVSGTDTTDLLVFSAEEPGDAANSTLAVRYQKPAGSQVDPYSYVEKIEFPFPNNHSRQIAGAITYKLANGNLRVVIATTPQSDGVTTYKGGLYSYDINGTTGRPIGYPVTGSPTGVGLGVNMVQIASFDDDVLVGGFSALRMGNDEASFYTLESPLRQLATHASSLKNLVNGVVDNGNAVTNISLLNRDSSNNPYCKAKLTSNMLNTQWKSDTGLLNYTFEPPLMLSASGYASEQIPIISAALSAEQKDLQLKPNLASLLKARTVASIEANATALEQSKMYVKNNAAKVLGDKEQTDPNLVFFDALRAEYVDTTTCSGQLPVPEPFANDNGVAEHLYYDTGGKTGGNKLWVGQTGTGINYYCNPSRVYPDP